MNNSLLIGGSVVALIIIISLSNLLLTGESAPRSLPPANTDEALEESFATEPTLPIITDELNEDTLDEPLLTEINDEQTPVVDLPVEVEPNLPPPPPAPPILATSPTDDSFAAQALRGTDWVWQETSGVMDTTAASSLFVLTFNDNGSMRSTTDCNNLGGLYDTTGNMLTFGDMFSTLMYCEGSQEQTYREQLDLVERYTIDETTLYLSLANNQGTMRFTAKN